MKPLALTMQAFGPFGGTESVDFTRLGEAPLFLINGPTGSGKTTILDAICYALYGSTTGDEREPWEMRCQQSDAGTLTEITFDFELGGNCYRVIRSPDQLRPKLKGEGFTEHKSRADLYRLDSDGTQENGELLVERKVKEATDYIKRLTGMEAEQFRQVMVLPQGQFRKLLMADSKEREGIFQTLFQTSIFKKIEDKLREESNDVRSAHRAKQTLIRNILDESGVVGEPELAEAIDEASGRLDKVTEARTEKQKAWQQADAALREARKLVEDFQRLDQAREQLNQLNEREKEVSGYSQQIDLARAAAKIWPAREKVEQLTQSRELAKAKLSDSQKALKETKIALKDAQTRLNKETARDPERAAAGAKINQLDSYSGKAEDLQSAMKTLKLAQESEKRASESLARSRKAVSEEAEKISPLRSNVAELEKSIGEGTGIDAEVQRLRVLLSDRKDLAKAERHESQANVALGKAEEKLESAQVALDAADQDHKRLLQRWHQGQAALLARDLKEGDPCPVCGSTAHPNPAAPAEDAVSEDELEAAAQSLEMARQGLLEASKISTGRHSELQAATRRKEELLEKLGEEGRLPVGEVQQRLDKAEVASKHLANNQQRLKEDRAAVAKLEENLADLSEAVTNAQGGMHEAQTSVTAAKTRYEMAEKALPEAYREPGKLEEALAAARSDLDSLKKQLERASQAFQEADKARTAADTNGKNALENLQSVDETLERVTNDWAHALENSVFATEQDVRLAAMAEEGLEQLETQVKQFDQDRITCSTRIETLQAQLVGKKPVDVSKLENAETQAIAARDQANVNWDEANQQLGMLEKTWKNLQARLLESKELDKRFRVVGTLAEVACGFSGAKISLQRYVLGKLLEDVLVEASLRLHKMSAGRYQLFRKQDPSKGRKASGLDLEVYDDYTGESRSVATLSGGESFMAALSLALGLSDVVQAQSGGIRLDTLFVDEGFGTLDSEALELAVSTLMDLQKSGRMVGVISHVAELKEQMDVRIDISKSQSGSSLKLISGFIRK